MLIPRKSIPAVEALVFDAPLLRNTCMLLDRHPDSATSPLRHSTEP
ncbi:MAG: hypothetical protein ABI171_13640 [Collimonas sp.]